MTTPEIIVVLAILAVPAFFCIGGFIAGEYYRKHGEAFRVGGAE